MSTTEETNAIEEVAHHATPREGYDRWAPHYDGYDNPLIRLEEPVVDALLGPCAGLRCADIGCGTGRRALRLARAGARVTGVDFSSGMLDVLRSSWAHLAAETTVEGSLEVVEHDLTDGIPLPGDGFDRVLCCLVIEHIPDVDRMVAELGRICRPGGRVIISDLHPEMVRRGLHARFHAGPAGTTKYQIAGAHHPISSYIMGAVRAGLQINHIAEHVMGEATAARSRSARKWLGLPFLFVLSLHRPEGSKR